MITFFTKYENISKENDLNPGYVKNWIKKQIKESVNLSDCEKQVLLEYPVVYVHAWENADLSYSIYVGETYNLTQRLGEHIQSEDGWHNEWQGKIKDGKAISWFFSCKNMNESMCLDLEHSLVVLLGKTKIKKKTISTTDPQDYSNYSNKDLRDDLLQEIWEELSKFKVFQLPEFYSMDKSCLTHSNKVDASGDLQFSWINPEDEGKIIKEIIAIKNPLINNYAMVYLYIWEENGDTKTYVGEANNLEERTKQHLEKKENWEKKWAESVKGGKAWLLMFGHKEFNKSMIKDIENRIILYTKFLECSQNLRHNERGKYDNQSKTFAIFEKMIGKLVDWQGENLKGNGVFESLSEVQKKAVGLASPFYDLSEDQKKIEYEILKEIDASIHSQKKTLIVLYGGAGTGKTMLLSSLLFDLYDDEKCKCDLVVNNAELAPTYHNMIKTWQLGKADATISEKVVYYANDYFSKEDGREVLLIDEGHLLFTRDYMRAKEQLSHIMDKAICTVLVFDPFQFVDKNKCWKGGDGFDNFENTKKSFECYFTEKEVKVFDLDKQLRMKCAENTFDWILSLSKIDCELEKLNGTEKCKTDSKIVKEDSKGYYVGVYRNLVQFYYDLCYLRKGDKNVVCIATYDWKNDPTEYWYSIEEKKIFHWHATGEGNNVKDKNGKLSSVSWYKREGVDADEVGAVHDIQGFDLSIAYIIIGPSIKYNPIRGNLKGKKGIQIYKNAHKTNKDIDLIRNELSILLTRGVKGIMLYAVDPQLRDALYNSLV